MFRRTLNLTTDPVEITLQYLQLQGVLIKHLLSRQGYGDGVEGKQIQGPCISCLCI